MKNSEDNFSRKNNSLPPLVEQFLQSLGRSGKSLHTQRAYKTDLVSFIKWFSDQDPSRFDIGVIDSQDILTFRRTLNSKGASPATVNRRLKTLRKFYAWSFKTGQVKINPFDAIEKLLVKEVKQTAPGWLEHNDQLALLRTVKKNESLRDYAIVQTFLGTGLRISELAALKISDLQISERSGWLMVKEGKGSKNREIPLDIKTRQALAAYLKEREEDTEKRLFVGQRGPLNSAGINYLIDKYARQANLPDCTPHTLRHSFAKNLVDAGVPLDQVAALLGHEDLNTTRIYTRPSRDDLEKAVRKASGEL